MVRALLGNERDELADLGVVDRVLEAVRRGRVGFAEVEPQVEDEPLADLALRCARAVVRVEREAGDLDRDRLEPFLILLALGLELLVSGEPFVEGAVSVAVLLAVAFLGRLSPAPLPGPSVMPPT